MRISIKKTLSFLLLLVLMIVLLKSSTTYALYPTNVEGMGMNFVNQGEANICIRNKIFFKEVNKDTNNIFIEPKPISIKIGIKNKLIARDLEEKQFKTNIKGVSDNTDNYKEFVLNDSQGRATFEEITFKKAGRYKYKVFETKGKDKKIKYDDRVFELEFNVELKEDNTLAVSTVLNKEKNNEQYLGLRDEVLCLEFLNYRTDIEIKGDKNNQSDPL